MQVQSGKCKVESKLGSREVDKWAGCRDAAVGSASRHPAVGECQFVFATVPSASVNVLHGTGLPWTGATVPTLGFIRCT